jgi:hypothetical protein
VIVYTLNYSVDPDYFQSAIQEIARIAAYGDFGGRKQLAPMFVEDLEIKLLNARV